MATTRKPLRAGRTAKVSISLDRADLAMLRKRARRFHRGNLSAVIAEGVRRVSEEEGREALVAWLGDAGQATPGERDLVRAEWHGPSTKRPKTA